MDQPKQISKYELREFLGGGMSHVYKAWDPVMHRIVAVKILTESATADQEAKARFLREAQTAGGLAHDNVIRVYDFGEENGRPFMVMEFLEGEDLRQAITNNRTGDLTGRLRIALEAAKALEYIHTESIVHRDIKPDNIHIDTSGRVRLMDFGIAKRQELNLTRAGFTLGTPYYMPPEQVRGDTVTHLADVYAFGILLFELLTGTKPITGETVEQLFYRIMNEPLDLEPLRLAEVPEPVCQLIAHCTAKDPNERLQSFTLIRQEIEQALRQPGSTPWSTETAPPPLQEEPAASRRNWIIPVAAISILVAIAAVFFVFRSRQEPELESEPISTPLTTTLSTPTGDMVLVPGGSFLFGADRESVQLGPFYIDKTEVTNASYASFCTETGRTPPEGFPENRPDYPVVNVTFNDALAFATWADKRMPTSREWEKAARGTDGRPYPWGDLKDPSRANVADNAGQTSDVILPAASFSLGASPYGALQIVGNVWEFVNDPIKPSTGALNAFADLLSPPPTAGEEWTTIRGGSFDIPLVENAAFEWSSVPARFRAANIGFRCVKDAR